jgi:hypothetical protein
MEGLARYTAPNCCICPELSKTFPSNKIIDSQQKIAGEIDFYLNSKLRRSSNYNKKMDSIGEHIIRFTPINGIYVSLNVNDYSIFDFRRTITGCRTNIYRHPNSITMFFKDNDKSVAQFSFGLIASRKN